MDPRHGEYAHLDAALFDQHHTDNLNELERNYRQIANQRVTDFQKLPIWGRDTHPCPSGNYRNGTQVWVTRQ